MSRTQPHDSEPPRFATRLLEWSLPAAEREFVLGDLAEAWHAMASAASGPASANRWYWRQSTSLLLAAWPRRASIPTHLPREQRMQSLVWDLGQAFRSLLRSRAHAWLAILTLAVGVGSATTLFSIVYPVLLQAPPYPDADQLVYISERDRDGLASNVGYPTFDDLRREGKSFSSMAVMSGWGPTVQLEDRAEPLVGQRVSSNYFTTLGVRPMLGREFQREEDTQETRNVVILAHSLWQRVFNADSGIVGRPVTISGRSYTVAGVMPRTFENLTSPRAEIWGPLGYDLSLPYACRSCRHLRVVARMRTGITTAAAEQEVERMLAAMRTTYPNEYGTVGSIVRTVQSTAVAPLKPVMLALGGAVLFLLLIACVNVANLVLGRSFERRSEFSLRSALGAGTTRLVRQVTVETLILAVTGSALGLGLAVVAMRLLPADFASTLPRTAVGQLNGTVLAFAVLAALASTVLAGLVPAIVALRGNVATTMREGGRAGDNRQRHRTRAALVVAEVTLAIVLLMGSGLLIRTMDALLRVDTGFASDGVVAMFLTASGPRYADDGAIWTYQRRVLDAARAVPGVTAAAVTSQLPLGGNYDAWGVHRNDKPSANPEDDPSAQRFSVSPQYFEVMKLALVQGRAFNEQDRSGSQRVALINPALARASFPGESPIGKAISVGGVDPDSAFLIVGIVDNVRHLALDSDPEPQMYLPFDQRFSDNGGALVVRGDGDTRALLRRVESAVRAVDPTVAISGQATMSDVVRASASNRQLALVVLSAFAAIALILSAAGIYGVIAASVAERTREIGVRAALGASRGRIVGQVVGQGALVSAVGLVLGSVAAVLTGRALRSMLYGVAPWDVPTLVGVSAVLAIVVLAACALPAWRAARVDPVTALRGG